ncbi:hypothetical protein DMENIID0001_141570 [Sergentomyia squamirostris]
MGNLCCGGCKEAEDDVFYLPSTVSLPLNEQLPQNFSLPEECGFQPARSSAITISGPLSPERERDDDDVVPLLHHYPTSTSPREGQQLVRPTHYSTGVSGARRTPSPYEHHHLSAARPSASKRGDIPTQEVPRPEVPRRVRGIERRRQEEERRGQSMAAFTQFLTRASERLENLNTPTSSMDAYLDFLKIRFAELKMRSTQIREFMTWTMEFQFKIEEENGRAEN